MPVLVFAVFLGSLAHIFPGKVGFLLISASPVSADLMRDSKTFKHYTSPVVQGVNQDEYHLLVWKCKDIQQQCSAQQAIVYNQQSQLLAQYGGGRCSLRDQMNAGQANLPNVIAVQITAFLQRMATPTSIRLLEDLQKCKFNF